MCTKSFKLILCFLVLGLSAGIAAGQIEVVKINFQQAGAPVPEGYLPDTGLVFGDRGNGFSYGWDHDISAGSRQRSGGPDQRYNSHAQFADEDTLPPGTWEIALPNGVYDLYIVCGDPANIDQNNTLDVEGVVVPDEDGFDNFDEYTVTVTVSDGRLTIQMTKETAESGQNAKIAFIDIYANLPPTSARTPSPEDGATDVPRDGIVLEWTAGESAASHDVYFGEVFEDVITATPNSDAFIGNQQGTTVPLDRLELGKTYYWRVDEVNAPPDLTVYRGETWSFTVELVSYPIPGENITATASSSQLASMSPENTINGSGLDVETDVNGLHSDVQTDQWLSQNGGPQPTWIQYEFDKLYKFHQVWVWNSNTGFESFFGLGIKDATVEYSTNGTDWTVIEDVPEFAKAPGTAGYAHNTEVDLGGVIAKYIKITANSSWGDDNQYGLSEVRFLHIPLRARKPMPSDGDTDIAVDVLLSWRAGREATEHVVYLDTDKRAVEDGQNAGGTVSEASYNPRALQLDETYYWRIDEVNIANTIPTWQGDVWSFSTEEFVIVDDFEDYDVDKPIWEYWLDGLGFGTPGEPDYNPGNGTGAVVGDDTSPSYMEESVVHGGDKSMPIMYDNSIAGLSEVTRSLSSQDWTASSIQSLVLYFHGAQGNTVGNLYVKINNKRVNYQGDASDLTRPIWTQWTIDLTTVETNLANVQTLTIGVDNGGEGTLYIDDIRLYRSAPAVGELIWLEAEAATTLGELWLVPDDPTASGGKYIGSLQFDGNHNSAPPGAEWLATYTFNVVGGDYEVMLRVQQNPSNSFWVRIPTATSQSRQSLEGGWINQDVVAPKGWAWNDVGGGEAVIWTLGPGSNTLEIAKREAGVSLDAIVITEVLN